MLLGRLGFIEEGLLLGGWVRALAAGTVLPVRQRKAVSGGRQAPLPLAHTDRLCHYVLRNQRSALQCA